jgi:succinyl-CoA synthetase alpha subunit
MTEVYDTVVRRGGVRLIGPELPRADQPRQVQRRHHPGRHHDAGQGRAGVRSGTLTYQIMHELAQAGIGISTCVGIGGDPVIGTQFLDVIQAFAEDPDTDAIAFVGEIGGSEEQLAGEWIRDNIPDTPVVGYIAGFEAPEGKQMGHAGAIVKEGGPGGESAAEKKEILEGYGISVAMNPSEAAQLMIERLSTGVGHEIDTGPAVSVWALAAPGGWVQPFRAWTLRPRAGGVTVAGWPDTQPGDTIVVLADPHTFPAAEVLERLRP